MLLSRTHTGDLAVDKLPKRPQCSWFVGKQIALGASVFADADRAVVDAVIEPMSGHFQSISELRNRQIAGNATRV